MAGWKPRPDVSGRLAPRWISDLASRLIPEIEAEAAHSITARLDGQTSQSTHVHDFVVIQNQTTPELQVASTVLSLVCRQCDHHFVVRVNGGEDDTEQLCNAGCPKYTFSVIEFPAPEHARLAHHIVPSTPWTREQVQEKRSPTYPLLCRAEYYCSVGDCPLRISVEVSEPRLALDWLRMLKDPERLRENLEKARSIDPDRFIDAKEETVDTAFSVLQTYIRNHLADPSARKISKRNKRFQVVFGHELLPLFYALGYSEETSDNKGVPEDVLSPQPLEPAPQGTSPTPVESLRAFVDYMLTEITHHNPSELTSGPLPSGAARLERELHCSNYAKRLDHRTVRNTHDFGVLGVLPQMHKTLVYYGYQVQCRACPADKQLFLDALMRISNDLSDEDLQERAVLDASLSDMPPSLDQSEAADAAKHAAKYFGFDNPAEGDDNAVLVRYGKKLASDADEAKKQLQILAAYRGGKRLQEAADGRMSYDTALETLTISENPDCPDDFVVAYFGTRLNEFDDNKFLWKQVVEALRVVAAHRDSPVLKAHYRLYAENRPDMPVGLYNIGNTCYMNSAMQMINTIKAIRDLVLNPGNWLINLETTDISARRIGSNQRSISVEEVIASMEFVLELGSTFQKLTSTSSSAIRPTQLLANSVLLNVSEVIRNLEKKEAQTSKTPQISEAEIPAPPPLPDRPTLGRVEHVDDVRDVDMINVSVDAVSETASTRSSGTLVDQTMENADPPHLKVPTIIEPAAQVITEDVTMTDATDPAAELAKKKEAIRKALSTQERASGTTQQDVEETVGTMLNHLQNVIVPYTTADGVQRDLITDTFFFELRRYRKKKGDASFEKSGNDTLERSIVAYPGDGPRTIYEAISEGLDLERIEGDTQLYGAISQMPKVFFVHIQRTQSINAKNNNVVAVEETMYLDRFMDVDQDSDLMRLRQCAWHLQYQYKLLVATQPEAAGDLETPEPKSVPVIFLDDEAEATSDSVLANQPAAPLTLSAQPFEVQLPVQHGLDSDPVSKPLSLDIEGLPNLKEIQAMGEKQIQATREAVDKLFLEHQTQKYGLHAVICHSGQMSAGHYWNWIHDKAAGRWLKFNDDKVTEVTDTAVVLAELNRAGEPYFLCYVRDDARDEIVEVPKRAPQPSDSQTDVVEITSDDMQDYTDIKSAATVEISVDDMSDGFLPIARHNSPVNGVNGTSPPTDKTPSA